MSNTPREHDGCDEQRRLLAAIEEGWADSEAGRVIDDDELDQQLAETLVQTEL